MKWGLSVLLLVLLSSAATIVPVLLILATYLNVENVHERCSVTHQNIIVVTGICPLLVPKGNQPQLGVGVKCDECLHGKLF
jgi:hypothetical protein